MSTIVLVKLNEFPRCTKKAPPFWIFNVSLLGLHTTTVKDALAHIDIPITFEERFALGLGKTQEIRQVGRVRFHERGVIVDGSPDAAERPRHLAAIPHLVLISVGLA